MKHRQIAPSRQGRKLGPDELDVHSQACQPSKSAVVHQLVRSCRLSWTKDRIVDEPGRQLVITRGKHKIDLCQRDHIWR